MGLALLSEDPGGRYETHIAGRDEPKSERRCSPVGRQLAGWSCDASSETSLRALFEKVGPLRHLVLTLSGAKGAGKFPGTHLSKAS